MCKKNKLYEFAIDENTWKDSEENLRVEAKKIIKEGDDVKNQKKTVLKDYWLYAILRKNY